jgi:hypothetical protein
MVGSDVSATLTASMKKPRLFISHSWKDNPCKRPTPISYLQTYENSSFHDSKSSPITCAPPSGDPAYGCCGRNGLRHPECTRSSIGAGPNASNNAFSDASTIAFTNTSLTYQPAQ